MPSISNGPKVCAHDDNKGVQLSSAVF